MIKKTLALLVLTVMLVTVFSACEKGGNSGDASMNLDINTADINFVTDGASTYNIVRPQNDSIGETVAASKLFKKYKEVFKVNPKNISDEKEDGGYEILVGETNRAESIKVKEQLINNKSRASTFTICSIGNKIVIFGMSRDSLDAAVNYFNENYLTGSVITGGINYTYVEEGNFNDVTIGGESNLGLYNIVYPRYNMSYVTKLEIDKLVDTFISATGFGVGTTTDFTVGEDSTEKVQTTVSETEIIVGDCELRDGVNKITDADKYEIRFVGKKVYLNGGSPKATAMAVAEFGKMLSSGSKDLTDGSSITGSYKAVEANYSNTENYKLTWNDEFDQAKIDTSKWEVDYKDATIGGAKGLNGKATHRSTEKSTFVKNGKLYILALQDDKNYYGGMLWTPRSMTYLYGYLELSTLHPKGDGFWTALWANSGADASGLYYQETNVEECYGEGTYVKGNIFAWPTDYCKQTFGATTEHKGTTHYAKTGRGFYMDFHTFGYEWMEGEAQFYCDGVIYGHQDTTKTTAFKAAYSTPAYLKLSMATGFQSNPLKRITQNSDDWSYTNAFVTEYVHLYQKAGQKLYKK